MCFAVKIYDGQTILEQVGLAGYSMRSCLEYSSND